MPRSTTVAYKAAPQKRQFPCGFFNSSPIWAPFSSTRFARSQTIERLLCCGLATYECLVSPGVKPISVSATVRHTDIVEIPMNDCQGIGPFQIKNDLRVATERNVCMYDLVVFSQ